MSLNRLFRSAALGAVVLLLPPIATAGKSHKACCPSGTYETSAWYYTPAHNTGVVSYYTSPSAYPYAYSYSYSGPYYSYRPFYSYSYTTPYSYASYSGPYTYRYVSGSPYAYTYSGYYSTPARVFYCDDDLENCLEELYGH